MAISVGVALCALWSGATVVRADWPTNSGLNLRVCPAAGMQLAPAIITDGAQGAIVAWSDQRSGNFDIYAQHILSTGAIDPVWPVNGVPVCVASSNQNGPVLVSDGAGGAVLNWTDFRGGSTSDIYAQHLLASGVLDAAWPLAGLAVCAADSSQISPRAVQDGHGGEFIAWTDGRDGPATNIYASHVLAMGAVDPAWPVNGLVICDAVGVQKRPALARSGATGAIVVWQDFRADTSGDIYAQRFTQAGSTDPAWPLNGLALCSATHAQGFPSVVSDGASGALVCWDDDRSGSSYDIYATRVLSNGSLGVGWAADGVPVCTQAADQHSPSLVSDGMGGAILAWPDFRNSTSSDLYAQHLLSSGAIDPLWPGTGLAICTATDTQNNQTEVSDGDSGMIVAWEDWRAGSGQLDIYAQHVLAAGLVDPGWTPNGAPLASAFRVQQSPQLLADGSGGAIAAWQDSRSGPTFDVYADRIQSNGQLGGTVVSVAPETPPIVAPQMRCQNPVLQRELHLAFSAKVSGAVGLEILDVAGRVVERLPLDARESSTTALSVPLGLDVAPGLYLVVLRAGETRLSARAVVLR